LVLGATGYLGTRVCEELARSGYKIVAQVRETSDRSIIGDYNPEYILGDLLEFDGQQAIQKRLEQGDIGGIISCVGEVDYSKTYEELRSTNVDTAESLVQIIKDSGQKVKLVYVGSVASRGFFQEPGRFDESVDNYEEGFSSYSDVKHEAEQIIRQSGVEAVIVQPGSLVGAGPGDTTTTNIDLIRKIVSGLPVLSGGASYTSVHQVAQGIVLSFEEGRTGETYLLEGENLSMREFAQVIKRVARKYFPNHFGLMTRLPTLSLPGGLAIAMGKKHILINEQQARLGSLWSHIDSSKAQIDLGYRHTALDLEYAVAETLKQICC